MSGILTLDGVTVKFGGVTAVKDVSLTVEPGQILGLIGPNGSGKTTMLNAISGLVKPAAGRIHLGEARIDNVAPHKRSALGIGRTLQGRGILGESDATFNALVGYHRANTHTFAKACIPVVHERSRAVNRAQAAAFMKTVGYDHASAIDTGLLPVGRQRMVDVGRALAGSPKVLLLDEPLAGLDARETGLLHDLLVRMAAEGVTIVVVEHHMEFVTGLCSHACVLNFGEKIAEGTPADVMRDPLVMEAYLGTGRTR